MYFSMLLIMKEILELIMDISSKKDIHVLISSHILPDIESACSHVVILSEGKLAAQGTISELKQIKYSLYEMKIYGNDKEYLKKLEKLGCKINRAEDKIIKIYMPPEKNYMELFKLAVDENVQIRHFVKSQTSLEDLFAKAVGEE